MHFLVFRDKTDYHDKADYYAKIINDKNFQRIVNLIDKDKVIYGGKYDINLRYIEPTIMDNVIESDAIMQEEIFGPVLPVLSYSNFDDALDYVLNNEKPLAGYLFSDDEKERNEFLNKI